MKYALKLRPLLYHIDLISASKLARTQESPFKDEINKECLIFEQK